MKRWSVLGPVAPLKPVQDSLLSVGEVGRGCPEPPRWSDWCWPGGGPLGGLFALGPSDGLDGAQGPVEPGLLGGLDLVEGQTQVVLQVLKRQEEPSLAGPWPEEAAGDCG